MNIHIFQIPHDVAGPEHAHEGADAFAHTGNPLQEWGEYGFILSSLQNQAVEENDLYGFLPPDFTAQTGLTAADARQHINDNPGYGAYVFSPCSGEHACYLNVFEQGNRLHPGFVEIAESFFREIGLGIDLRTLATPTSAMVLGAHIVAKPEFWRMWAPLAEKLVELACERNSAFYQKLAATARPENQPHARVLLIERLASLVLTLCPDIALHVCETAAMAGSSSTNPCDQKQIDLLEQIKEQAGATNDVAHLKSFYVLRGAILTEKEGSSFERAKNGFLSTPFEASPDILYVCYTHVPQFFDYPSFVQTLCLGEAQGEGKTNLRDIAPEWELYHPILGASAGAFAVRRYIVENQLKIKHIGLCQYRKFVSAVPVSEARAENYPAMRAVSRDALENIDLAQAMLPGHYDFVLPELATLPNGYLNQYSGAHPVEDFLRFTSEATELGVLSRNEISTFFNCQLFIPGGIEVGVYPTDFWVSAMTSVEAVVRACLSRYPYNRTGYQARVWSFCAERLGSYLLLKHLNAHYLGQVSANVCWGRLNLVTEAEAAVYVPGR